MNKKEIRQRVLRSRMDLTPKSVQEKSHRIMDQILSSRFYQEAKSLMVYIDFKNEVETGHLIKQALEDRKRVSVPITDMKAKKLTPSRLLAYPDDLAPGTWGILEPKPGCLRLIEPEELDLIVVPGIAFDPKGYRIGYGGGFYDRFLPQTRTGSIFISPAYELQVVEQVLPESNDVPVHALFTEDRMITSGVSHPYA